MCGSLSLLAASYVEGRVLEKDGNNSHSVTILNLTGPLSSLTRQRSPFYQVQCSAQIDALFYNVLCWRLLSSCHLLAAFEIRILEISWKINLDQTVGIHDHNLDCLGLRYSVILCHNCYSVTEERASH